MCLWGNFIEGSVGIYIICCGNQLDGFINILLLIVYIFILKVMRKKIMKLEFVNDEFF